MDFKSAEYRAARKRVKNNVKASAKKKRKISGLDKYVIFSFVAILIYTIAQTVVTIKTGVESSTLTTCFFSVFGGEVLMCALIKRLKLKNESKKNESEEQSI